MERRTLADCASATLPLFQDRAEWKEPAVNAKNVSSRPATLPGMGKWRNATVWGLSQLMNQSSLSCAVTAAIRRTVISIRVETDARSMFNSRFLRLFALDGPATLCCANALEPYLQAIRVGENSWRNRETES